MSLLCVGSVALDTLEGPFGREEDILGGAASFFATSAAFFTPVQVVAVVGADFPEEHLDFFRRRGIDLEGLERQQGKSFRWGGRYPEGLATRETLFTDLGVFEKFQPKLPASYRAAPFVFLANIDPDLQREVVLQATKPKFVAADTMNFWISGKREALCRTLEKIDLLVINDEEVRQLADETNLIKAARRVRALGPKSLVVKRGDAGAMLFVGEEIFVVPGFPLEEVTDPTGAGDAFAGGLMGTLAREGDVTADALRRSVVYGSVMGSFAVERIGLGRLQELRPDEIDQRFGKFRDLVSFSTGTTSIG